MSETKIRVFIVAGGKSRRMGKIDKTRLEIEGEPMITRAMSMGLELGARVEVVADRWDRFLDLGIFSHEDVGDKGPVDAWRRVLEELRDGEVAVLLPVDLKTFSVSWVERLLRVAEETQRPAAFISPSHTLEPYPCVIPRVASRELLGEESTNLRGLLEALRVVRTTRPENFPEHPSLNERSDIMAVCGEA